ncbi:MAG: ATP synthase subunit I [Pseudomonadota bacterium]
MVKVLLLQLGVGLILAAGFWGASGTVAGYSALLGSLACVVPNAFLALRLALPRPDPGAKALMRAAYIGEAGKLAITVLIFSVVFAFVKPISAMALFVGFIATQLTTFAGLSLRTAQVTEETSKQNGE